MVQVDPLLIQLADSVSAATTLEDLVRPLLEMLEDVTGLESTYLTTIDLQQGFQHILFARNSEQLTIPEGLAVPWQDTLCRRALEEDRPYTDNVGTCWGDSDAARKLGIATYVSTAVRTTGGNLYGTLCAASSSAVPLAPGALKILSMFSRLIGQHVEREQLLEQLRKINAELAALALTDPLTGLPNRRSLILELSRMLARAQRDGSPTLIAFIDLDGFKAINDTHGHEIGDRFLKAVAATLSTSLRAGDLIARIGGDEFVIVTTCAHVEQAGALYERLSKQTAARFQVGDVVIDYEGGSVGVVTIAPGAADAEAALRLADAAMYEVKRSRRRA